jgi:hypothetical protein
MHTTESQDMNIKPLVIFKDAFGPSGGSFLLVSLFPLDDHQIPSWVFHEAR